MSLNIPIAIPDKPAFVAHTGMPMQMPMRIGSISNAELWLLPLEPKVSVYGANVITRRTVAKSKGIGSVKEMWTTDDYEITISGTLYDWHSPLSVPNEMITKLTGLLQQRKPIVVECTLLDILGINQLAIQSWEFPETQNIGYQDYVIKAFSDNNFNLLIEQ